MKTPIFLQPNARKSNIWRSAGMAFVVLAVVLASTLASAPPAKAAALDGVNAPTASYGCTGVYHRVRSGETLYSIAARYGSTAYRIASCNGLRSYTVYVGQSLLVPVYRRGSSGWLEGIDFMRDASQPPQEMLAGDALP
jgi:LysM repeat protein